MNPPRSRIESRVNSSVRAGLVRVGFALVAVAFADAVFPNVPSAFGVFTGYLGLALVFQLLIQRRVAASDVRSLSMGMVDIAFLSYAVYLGGPASSVLPFVFLLIPVINAASSSSRSRVAMRLAFVGAVAYAMLLVISALELVPYAPAQGYGAIARPSLAQHIASGIVVVTSVLATTGLVLRQMIALDRANQRLSELSHRDELTGLYNRRHLLGELRLQLDRVARGARCATMMVDLDGFKQVNDFMGHDAGDLVLRDIAQALTEHTRTVDMVARYGGDEFVVILPDVQAAGAVLAAERVLEAVARAGRARWTEVPVTASIGLTMLRPQDDAGSVLRRADAEAYAAKRAGGNRLSVSGKMAAASSGVVATAAKPASRVPGAP